MTQPYGPPPGQPAPPYGQPAPAPRPFYKKKRFIIPAALLVLVIGVGGTSSDEAQLASPSGSSPTTAPTSSSSSTPAAPQATTAPPAAPQPTSAAPAEPSKPSDGGLVLESYRIKNAFGTCTASARVTNNNEDTESGAISMQLLKGGEEVVSLTGFFNEAEAGDTQSVDLFGDAACPGKVSSYEVDFSRDF